MFTVTRSRNSWASMLELYAIGSTKYPMISPFRMASASVTGTTLSRPVVENALTTAAVMSSPRPAAGSDCGTWDGHRLDVGRQVAADGVAAAPGRGSGRQGPSRATGAGAARGPHARVTMFTSRPGTTTTLATWRPSSHGRMRPSVSASSRISASAAATSAVRRLRTRPSTWTTIWTSSRAMASRSATGHRCVKRLSPWPSAAHSSSVMCGQTGPSRRSAVSSRLAQQRRALRARRRCRASGARSRGAR